jgi:hypothetical protein
LFLPGIPDYPSSVYSSGQWVLEGSVVLGSLANIDVFIGLTNNSPDPFGVGQVCAGACFSASRDASNWLAVNNSAGTLSTDKSAGTVAASTSAMSLVRVTISSSGVTVSVNGTTISSVYSTNFPTSTALMPSVAVITRTSAPKDLYIERLHDWVQ